MKRRMTAHAWIFPCTCLLAISLAIGCGAEPPPQPRPTPKAMLQSAGKDLEEYDPTSGIPKPYHFLYTHVDEEIADLQRGLPYTQITFERTECFGTCPSYVITLHSDGTATYNGRKYSQRTGPFTGEVWLTDYGKLCWMIDRFKLLAGPRNYYANATDRATTNLGITLRDTNETITISDYGDQGPIELWAVFNAIDAVANRIEWTPEGSAPKDDTKQPSEE